MPSLQSNKKRTTPDDIKIGTKVWYADGGGLDKLSKGKVVAITDVPPYGIQYIIAVPTAIEDLLIIRDFDTITLHKKGPLHWLYKLKDHIVNNS